jgi:5-methylcytosine-specific restriction endonuclease McrA
MEKQIRERVWNKYGYKCAYCGEDLEYNKMQVDHIEAKYLGGKDNIENYNPSCRQCNFYKGTFSIEGFKEQLSTLTERIKKPFIVRLAIKYNLISFKPFDGKFYYEKINNKNEIQH